jgi:hypothetical protein
VVLLTIAASVPAFASGNMDVETAQQQFDLGRAQVRAGHCDLAVENFRASIAAAPNVGAWLNLGDCLERLEEFQEAYEAQRAAEALAAEKRDARLAVARESAERIQAKVVTLVVTMPPDVHDVELSVDGQAIPRERWSAILVSPSETHSIVARAPGASSFSSGLRASRKCDANRSPIRSRRARAPSRQPSRRATPQP